MRGGAWFTAVAALLAVAVAGCGTLMVRGPGAEWVWVGALLAFSVQVLGFWLLFVWALPGQPLLAHGLGLLLRFALVGATAFGGVSLLGAPGPPLLLSLVAVLALTTVFEPVILKTASSTRR